MRVLKTGEENINLEIFEISCTGKGIHNDKKKPCGALLEANQLDVVSAIHYDYGGGSDTYYYVVCPICGCKTEVFKKGNTYYG